MEEKVGDIQKVLGELLKKLREFLENLRVFFSSLTSPLLPFRRLQTISYQNSYRTQGRGTQGKEKIVIFAVMNNPLLASIVEEKLARRDIRATSSRILVLRALMTTESALALSDLEAILPTLDKSTLFRTLTTFAAHHLVHVVEDGSGLAKYALCSDDCHCGEDDNDELADLHTHFYCERCQRTFCLRGVPVPIPALPEGFSVRTVGFVVKGICDKCSGAQP
ncbi:hypothetical protein HMPREF9999_00676 [Alloprevotella sp. oral taxon 473 str. F0040]|nr:hypothetical protein HMPREF9999_00676 [Alloprevotella sp. oral taxon 473 str. F0040]